MGPFPTEIPDGSQVDLRTLGNEFGATTGRPRRCGWFDAVIANHAVRVNGLDGFAVTKLDVLDSLSEIKVCTAYEYKGKRITNFPCEITILEDCQPVYETFPGWRQDTSEIRDHAGLPENAQRYLAALAELTGTNFDIISVGSGRKQTIRVTR
jgi:adenylosuccinate synthase